MKAPAIIAIIVFVILFALHHDYWNWANSTLVFGFIPAGLAYHAGYSVVAAVFWYLVSKFAWPHAIEKWADQPND